MQIIYTFQACRWTLAWLLLVHLYGCKGLWWLAKDQSRRWNWRLKKLSWYVRFPPPLFCLVDVYYCHMWDFIHPFCLENWLKWSASVNSRSWLRNRKFIFPFGLKLRRDKTIAKFITFKPIILLYALLCCDPKSVYNFSLLFFFHYNAW